MMDTNPQVALYVAAEMDHNFPKKSEGERTRETLARAHQFLAFLEGADKAIEEDKLNELKTYSEKIEAKWEADNRG